MAKHCSGVAVTTAIGWFFPFWWQQHVERVVRIIRVPPAACWGGLLIVIRTSFFQHVYWKFRCHRRIVAIVSRISRKVVWDRQRNLNSVEWEHSHWWVLRWWRYKLWFGATAIRWTSFSRNRNLTRCEACINGGSVVSRKLCFLGDGTESKSQWLVLQ